MQTWCKEICAHLKMIYRVLQFVGNNLNIHFNWVCSFNWNNLSFNWNSTVMICGGCDELKALLRHLLQLLCDAVKLAKKQTNRVNLNYHTEAFSNRCPKELWFKQCFTFALIKVRSSLKLFFQLFVENRYSFVSAWLFDVVIFTRNNVRR